MRHFFMNAWFITDTQDILGTLADTAPGRLDNGFLSFVRLIGTVYFKKHLAEFTVTTPRTLYMSFSHWERNSPPSAKQGLSKSESRDGHAVCTLQVHLPISPCPTVTAHTEPISQGHCWK